MTQGPKLFTCPQCRHQYLGHDPVPDCPRCGHDYRAQEGVRWDLVVYLLAILGLVSYLLVSSNYRTGMAGAERGGRSVPEAGEKLPGAGTGAPSPYHQSESGR